MPVDPLNPSTKANKMGEFRPLNGLGSTILISLGLLGFAMAGVPSAAYSMDVERLNLVIAAPGASGQTIDALPPGQVRMLVLNEQRVTVSYRNDQFRGSRLLVLQLGFADDHHRSLQLDQFMPSRQWLDDDWRIDAHPQGWLSRYCAAFEAIDEPVERPASAMVTAGGYRFISPPDWDGHARVPLVSVHAPDRESGWQVSGSDRGDYLTFEHQASDRSFELSSIRDDMPVLRYQDAEGGPISYGFTPAAYAFRLCQDQLPAEPHSIESLEQQLTDYFFGINPADAAD